MAQAHAQALPARFRAFISYSHRDEAWAVWLHKSLEAYRVPSRLVGQATAQGEIPARLTPVFRDRDELPSSPDLNSKVAEALAQSESLIVVCSPHSATSHWVNEEVLAFKRLGRSDRVFCLIVDGEPGASMLPGREAEECFGKALRHALADDGTPSELPAEPIAADMRPGKDGKNNARLKLIAGLLGVGFDRLKQREQQRRLRRMTAVAAIAIIVTVVTTALAINAVVARGEAERRQKQAEDLVDFMLGDLNDKLAKVQRLDIMEAVDDQAMKYFQSLPTRDVTDESLVQRAKALEKIGSVRFDQGQLPDALEAYQASLDLAGRLAVAKPDDVPRQLAHARILSFVGQNHWYQGDLDAALQAFESAQRILRLTDRRSPGNPELKFQQVMLANNIGHILESRGMLDQAMREYRWMLELSQALVATNPDKTKWQEHLGMAHNNLGKQALIAGDLANAIAEYHADDVIETRLSEADPKDNNQRTNMLVVRAILGRTLALTGDVESGKHYLEQAIDIAAQMAAIDPSNTSVQELLALYSSQLARLQRLDGNAPSAGTLTARAVQIFTTLTDKDPSNAAWKREMAEALVEQSAQSHAAGAIAAARQQAKSALNLLDPLFAANPDDQRTLLAAVAARLRLADASSSDTEKAALREKALRTLQTVKSGKDDPRLRALLVEALVEQKRNSEADLLIRKLWHSGFRDPELLSLLQRKHIDYPVNTEFQQRLQATVAIAKVSGGRPGTTQSPHE
ncbi:MAG TPA: toll/interleukin-1 receptor domain-containing protein [Dokdonella sp.]|uniref:toll/interleukin-1 receptor domain-containing protein n=1 Tax=Dokdonella sp. TaxID=2291710 RepID=UPI002D7E290D|nr:toll/interleukin-1 receptor domain-containing protein [Dokdonella sp.]HET9033473.1 toll/interleukin-1 receptor domain-containing protein [Dokdonella sp.]